LLLASAIRSLRLFAGKVFAAVSTIYLAAAIPFEERSLRRDFGEEYDRYSERVTRKMVPFVY